MATNEELRKKIEEARAMGYGDDDIARAELEYRQRTGLKKGNFLTSALPTIAGVIGAVGGSVIAPGVGTVAGGAGGSAIGEALRQRLLGETGDLKKVGVEAAFGAIPGGIGGGARAVKGVRAVKKGVDAAKGARATSKITPVTEDIAEMITRGEIPESIATTTARPSNWMAQKSLASIFQVPRKMAQQLDPQKTAKELLEYKIPVTGIEGVASWSKDALSRVGPIVDEAVRGVKGSVSTDGVSAVVKNAAGKKGVLGEKQAMEIAKEIERIIYPPGVASANVKRGPFKLSAQHALKAERELSEAGHAFRFAAESAQGAEKLMLSAKADVYLEAAKSLSKGIDDVAVKEGVIASVKNPENFRILAEFDPLLAKRLMDAKSVKEIRGIMAPFVRASRLADYTAKASSIGLGATQARLTSLGIGGAGGFALGGPIGAGAGMLASPWIEGGIQAARPVVQTAAARTAQAVGGAVGDFAGSTAGKIAGQTVGQTAVRAPFSGGSMDIPPSPQMSPSLPPTGVPQTSPSGYDPERIKAAMMMDWVQTGGENAKFYQSILDSMGGDDLSAAAEKTVMGTNTANQLISQVESALSQLPAGRIAGTAQKIAGKVGLSDAASSYESQRPAIALMMIKAIMGSAGQISDADRNAIQNSIPSVSDTAGERQRKLTTLRGIVQAYQSAALSSPGSLPENPGETVF